LSYKNSYGTDADTKLDQDESNFFKEANIALLRTVSNQLQLIENYRKKIMQANNILENMPLYRTKEGFVATSIENDDEGVETIIKCLELFEHLCEVLK
jgi:hypothetical protein